jgi:hypothetical protein
MAGTVPAVVVATLIRGKDIADALKEAAKFLKQDEEKNSFTG